MVEKKIIPVLFLLHVFKALILKCINKDNFKKASMVIVHACRIQTDPPVWPVQHLHDILLHLQSQGESDSCGEGEASLDISRHPERGTAILPTHGYPSILV